MTTPINPASGAPIQRSSADKPKGKSESTETFKVSDSGDTVQTPGKLSFGSLRPLINTQLTTQTATITAQQTAQQLGNQPLPVVNNRPHVVANLIDAHDQAHNG
jgi:hypothetical protein